MFSILMQVFGFEESKKIKIQKLLWKSQLGQPGDNGAKSSPDLSEHI